MRWPPRRPTDDTMRRLRMMVLPAAVLGPWSWYLWRDLGGGLDGWFLQTLLDLVSMFLPVLCAGAAVAFLVAARSRRSWLLATASWIVFAMIATVAPWQAQSRPAPTDPIRIVYANLFLSNGSSTAADVLAAADADLVITAETNGTRYLDLRSRLGEPLISTGDEGGCSLDGPAECGSLNVWSRLPAVVAGDQTAAERARGVRLEVTGPSGPVVVYAVHAEGPAPFGVGAGRASFAKHRDVLGGLLDAAKSEATATIVVGDLNLSDRQSGYRDFTRTLHDAMRRERAGPTGMKWYLRPLFLRIDHLFVPRDWCSSDARRFSVPGSDHRGIVAEVGPCPTGAS
jgi:endonuclease/exonuclease/phosphatase (EEP) superfamily protein YafD